MPGGEAVIGGDEDNARPPFKVRVEPFYIGKFPVTNEQFQAFDPSFEPAPISPADRDPAAGVSFEAAQAYCEWYAEVSRKPMRLPTEIEWEYACRGGVCGETDVDEASIDDLFWHAGNSGDRIGRLDAKKSNDFGLYGMLGGVWEWTCSVERPYPLAEPFGGGDPMPRRQILRGGSVRLDRSELSCSLRRAEDTATRQDDVGFRIVKSFR